MASSRVSPIARLRVLYGLALEGAPQVFAVLTFASGAVMLISAVQPPFADRLHQLRAAAPILVVELSHFLASIVGFLLLLVAAGLWRRRRGAYWSSLGLLLAGAAFSLTKGLDIEETAILLAVAALLAPCRPAFYRTSIVDALAVSTRTFLFIAAAVAAALILGLFSFADAPYSDELWWRFVWDAELSRALRAGAAVLVLTLVFAVFVLIRGSRAAARARPTPAEIEAAVQVLARARAGAPDAWLALVGDKSLLFSRSGESFLAYQVRGTRWIAMGEPAGRPEEFMDLVWGLVESADRAGGKAVFYAVSEQFLPHLASVGLTIRKIGESAFVDAETFTLAGRARQDLRTGLNRAQREGIVFEVLPPGSASAQAESLAAVSEAWLRHGKGEEKAFSLGRFDPEYLDRTPLLVARRDGEVLAFANLLVAPGGRAAQIDLMRHVPAAPPGLMDALFVHAILWAKAAGCAGLDLGMSPLAGIGARRLSPLFYRLSDLVFELGEPLYGFKGLRSYKAKFFPQWRPVFMAAAPGAPMLLALLDVVLLTNGGWRGLLGLRRLAARGRTGVPRSLRPKA